MAYRAQEIAARAALLRDLRADDTGDMLAYCARVLEVLERRALAEQHGLAAPSPSAWPVRLAPLLTSIQEALDRQQGVQAAVAREVGLSVRSVRYYVARYRLTGRSE